MIKGGSKYSHSMLEVSPEFGLVCGLESLTRRPRHQTGRALFSLFVDNAVVSFQFTLTLLFDYVPAASSMGSSSNHGVSLLWKKRTHTHTHTLTNTLTQRHGAQHRVKPGSEVKIAFSSHLQHHSRLPKWERAYLTECYISASQLRSVSAGILSLPPPFVSAGQLGWCTVRDVFAFVILANAQFRRDVIIKWFQHCWTQRPNLSFCI